MMEEKDLSDLRKEIRETTELARAGKWDGNLIERLGALHKSGELDPSLLLNFGWLIYFRLKHTPLNSVLARKRLLVQYLNLELERPSLLHSLILGEALKTKKSTPSQFKIRDFVALWGIENLREEDWEKFKSEKMGHSSNSLVENLIGVYTREIKKDRTAASEDFGKLLDKAIAAYPSNPHLPLYRPIVLESRGQKEEALDCYRRLLKRWPRKFFLWSRAEELLPRADTDTRIALLCRAVTLVRDKSFLGDIRLRLAHLLNRKGMNHHAKHELNQYLQLYSSQGWHIKNWYDILCSRVEGAAPGVAPAPTPYDSFIALASQF